MLRKAVLWLSAGAASAFIVVGMFGPALAEITKGMRPRTYTTLLIVGIIAMSVIVPIAMREFGVRRDDRRFVVRALRLSPALIAVVAMFTWMASFYGHRTCEMLPPGLRCDCFYVGATKPATTPLQVELRDWYREAFTTICKLPLPAR